jgi:SMODS and SLOG-associating 2TM effector domain 3/SMODS and SLOG-associating 2TM effector domain 1
LANGNAPASSQVTDEAAGAQARGLGVVDLPAAYAAANELAARAQRRFLNLQRAQILIPLVAIAVGLVATLDEGLGYLGVLATASAAAVATLRLVQRTSRVETAWYEARAVAEEVKSLAWRYAAGGAPFDQDHADELFAARVGDAIRGLPDDPATVVPAPAEATSPMRALRDADLAARQHAYREQRLDEQLDWYRRRVLRNRAWASRCDLGLFLLTGVTVLAGAFLVADSGDADVLGPIVGLGAAGSAAVVAWSGIRRYASLSVAYQAVVVELEHLDARAAGEIAVAEWPAIVANVEDVLGREHLQWRAARR